MRFKFFILLVLLLHSLGFAGFDPETLVVTPGGYQRMGRLQVGDPILSACKNNWHATAGQIQHRRACKQQFVIAIELPEDIIYASQTQYFYNLSLSKWVPAQDLAVGDLLLNIDGKAVVIKQVCQITTNSRIDSIEIAKFHNYFVSKHCVLVHNEPISIGIGLTWAFGSGAIEYLGAHATVFIAGLIGVKLFKGSDNKYDAKPEINVEGWNNRGPGHEPDNDDDEDEGSGTSDIGIGVDDILAGAKRGDKTKGPSKIFEKRGDFSDAQRDFNKLKPSNVKKIDKGLVGTLKDGRVVNVRNDSSDTRPTLEIRRGKKSIKVRYGTK